MRVWLVGNSGSGKTHLARRTAQVLGLPHLELDALNHRPGWVEAPVEEFRAEVRSTLQRYEREHGGWVVDGNYRRRVGDLIEPDVHVWLDYPRSLVMRRVVRRTLGRVVLRRPLWNGNRERWRNLVSRDPRKSIVLWSWTQHAAYRRQYAELMSTSAGAGWVRLRDPQEAERWLEGLTAQR